MLIFLETLKLEDHNGLYCKHMLAGSEHIKANTKYTQFRLCWSRFYAGRCMSLPVACCFLFSVLMFVSSEVGHV